MLVAETRKLAVVMEFTFVFSLENHNLFRKIKHHFWGGSIMQNQVCVSSMSICANIKKVPKIQNSSLDGSSLRIFYSFFQ